jgi:hypothetical protein
MVKRSFLPGQPPEPSDSNVQRGPSRFLEVTPDRTRGVKHNFGYRPGRP